MAITFVGSLSNGAINGGSPTFNGAGSMTTTGGGSGGTAVLNDFLIAISAVNISRAAGNGAISGGTSVTWTERFNSINGVDGGANAIRVRVATAFVPTATLSGSITAAGTANAADGDTLLTLAFRGVDTTTPLDVASVSAGPTTSATPDPASITPTNANCCIVTPYAITTLDTTGNTAPTNYTLTAAVTGTDTNNSQIGAAYRILSGGAGAAENPGTFGGLTSGVWFAFTLALRESGAGLKAVPIFTRPLRMWTKRF